MSAIIAPARILCLGGGPLDGELVERPTGMGAVVLALRGDDIPEEVKIASSDGQYVARREEQAAGVDTWTAKWKAAR